LAQKACARLAPRGDEDEFDPFENPTVSGEGRAARPAARERRVY
jgi:hypothetical protein